MFETKKERVVATVTIIIVILSIFSIVWYMTRNRPFMFTIQMFLVVAIFFSLIIGVIYVIIWLFRKKRLDLLAVAKENLIDSAKLLAPEISTRIDLFDGKESRTLGSYKGHVYIRTEDFFKSLGEEDKVINGKFRDTLETKRSNAQKRYRQEHIIILAFKPKGSPTTELVLLTENDINGVHSNPITIFDIGFAPKIYEFHILAKYYDVAQYIEGPIVSLMGKYTIQEMLRDQVAIIQKSIDLDSQFLKDREKSNIDDYRGGENRSANTK